MEPVLRIRSVRSASIRAGFSEATSQPICRSSRLRKSSCSSTSRPRRRSASKSRGRSSPAPTRSLNEADGGAGQRCLNPHPERRERMLKKTALCATVVTFGMLLSLNAQPQPSPVQPSPVKRTILQRADVPGTNLETIYATVEIAAGFKAGRHNQPCVVMAHILDGDFRPHLGVGLKRALHAVKTQTMPDHPVHNDGA